jgi:hypothetical protein
MVLVRGTTSFLIAIDRAHLSKHFHNYNPYPQTNSFRDIRIWKTKFQWKFHFFIETFIFLWKFHFQLENILNRDLFVKYGVLGGVLTRMDNETNDMTRIAENQSNQC